MNRIEPNMVKAIFDNWEQSDVARIQASQNYIMVAGRVYERWTGDSGLSLFTTGDGAMWAPPIEDIRGMHFRRNGVTDQQAVTRALAWAAAYSETVPITSDKGLPLVIDWRAPMQWQLTAPVDIVSGNAALTMMHGNFKMTGGGWTDADPYAAWTWHAYAAASMTAGQVEAAAREQFYRVRKSDYLFNVNGASRVNFFNQKIDCNQLGGGLSLAAGNTADLVQIEGCAGAGMTNAGGGTNAVRCSVFQWHIGDPQYFFPAYYTGIGFFSENSDFYVTDCEVAWMYELGRFERTNSIIRAGHWYNGSQQYNAVDRVDMSDADNEALFEFGMSIGNPYGWVTAVDARAQDFTPRAKNVGLTNASRLDQATYEADPLISPVWLIANVRQDLEIQGWYPDNLVCDFYCNGWKMSNTAFGLKASSSLSPIGALIRSFAPTINADARFRMADCHPLVESGPKHYLGMKAGLFGETWREDFSAFNTDTERNWTRTVDGARGMGFSIGSDGIEVTIQSTNPNKEYHNPGDGSFSAWSDGTTTVAAPLMAGALGNEFQIKAEGGNVLLGINATAGAIRLPGTVTYANNAAAVAAGLAVGMFYVLTATNALTRVV